MFKKIFRGSVTAGSGVVLFVSGSSVASAEGEDYSFLLNKEYNKDIDPLLDPIGKDTFKIRYRPTYLDEKVRKILEECDNEQIAKFLELDKEERTLACKLQDLRLQYLNDGQFLDDKGEMKKSIHYNEDKCKKEILDCYKQLVKCRDGLKVFLKNNKKFFTDILSPLEKFGIPGFGTDEAEAFETVESFNSCVEELCNRSIFSRKKVKGLDADVEEISDGVYKIKNRPNPLNENIFKTMGMCGEKITEFLKLDSEECQLACKLQDLRYQYLYHGQILDNTGKKRNNDGYDVKKCMKDIVACYFGLGACRDRIEKFLKKNKDSLEFSLPQLVVVENHDSVTVEDESKKNTFLERFISFLHESGEELSLVLSRNQVKSLDAEVEEVEKGIYKVKGRPSDVDYFLDLYEGLTKDKLSDELIEWLRKECDLTCKFQDLRQKFMNGGWHVNSDGNVVVEDDYKETDCARNLFIRYMELLESREIFSKKFFEKEKEHSKGLETLLYLFKERIDKKNLPKSFLDLAHYVAGGNFEEDCSFLFNEQCSKDLDVDRSFYQPKTVHEFKMALGGIFHDFSNFLDYITLTDEIRSLREKLVAPNINNIFDFGEEKKLKREIISKYLRRKVCQKQYEDGLSAVDIDNDYRHSLYKCMEWYYYPKNIEFARYFFSPKGSYFRFFHEIFTKFNMYKSFLFNKEYSEYLDYKNDIYLTECDPPAKCTRVREWQQLYVKDFYQSMGIGHGLFSELFELVDEEYRLTLALNNLRYLYKNGVLFDFAVCANGKNYIGAKEYDATKDVNGIPTKPYNYIIPLIKCYEDRELSRANIKDFLSENKDVFRKLLGVKSKFFNLIEKVISGSEGDGSMQAFLSYVRPKRGEDFYSDYSFLFKREFDPFLDEDLPKNAVQGVCKYFGSDFSELAMKYAKDREELTKVREKIIEKINKGCFNIYESVGFCDKEGKSEMNIIECFNRVWETTKEIAKYLYNKHLSSEYSPYGRYFGWDDPVSESYRKWSNGGIVIRSERILLEKDLLGTVDNYFRKLSSKTSEINYSKSEYSDLNKAFIYSNQSLDDV